MGTAGHARPPDHVSEKMRIPRRSVQKLYAAHGEKLRFLIVGAWNTLFSYVLFAVLLYTLGPVLKGLSDSSSPVLAWVGAHWYLAVQWLSWLIAVPQSTLTMKFFVFRSRGHMGHEIWRSFFVYLPMQALSSVSLWLLVSFVGLHPLTGQLLTVGLSAVMSYLGHKYFTFRQSGDTGTA